MFAAFLLHQSEKNNFSKTNNSLRKSDWLIRFLAQYWVGSCFRTSIPHSARWLHRREECLIVSIGLIERTVESYPAIPKTGIDTQFVGLCTFGLEVGIRIGWYRIDDTCRHGVCYGTRRDTYLRDGRTYFGVRPAHFQVRNELRQRRHLRNNGRQTYRRIEYTRSLAITYQLRSPVGTSGSCKIEHILPPKFGTGKYGNVYVSFGELSEDKFAAENRLDTVANLPPMSTPLV